MSVTIKHSKYSYLIKTENEIGQQLTTGEVTFQALSRFIVWRSRYSLDLRMQSSRVLHLLWGKGILAAHY